MCSLSMKILNSFQQDISYIQNFKKGSPQTLTNSTINEYKPPTVSAIYVLAQRKAGTKYQYTSNEIKQIISGYIGSDKRKINRGKNVFNYIKNLDLKNIEKHLDHIKTLISCVSNDYSTPFANGYFSSEDGLKAFDILLKHYSTKPISVGHISPICIPLEDYKPEEIIKANERGLIEQLKHNNFVKNMTKLSDEEFEEAKQKALKRIQDTGKNYQELLDELQKKMAPLITRYNVSEDIVINEFTIVPYIKILDLLENYPIKFENYSLSMLLSAININNYESCQNILHQLKNRQDISQSTVTGLIELSNPKTENILAELIADKEIPLEKIIEYSNENFKKGLVSQSEMYRRINNDAFLKTIRNISAIDIKSTDTTPVNLNPTNITPDSLVLVHMTNYEPENGVLLSTRDKIGGSRNSVHFTLNHPVREHVVSWNHDQYAIIMPWETAVKENPKSKFKEGMPNDIYTNGSVKIPKGSIIVKYNENIPEGTINMTDSNSIKGVKVIETSQYPHSIVPEIIKKMGYTYLEADGPCGLFSYGENQGRTVNSSIKNYNAWKSFCDLAGIKPAVHSFSPGGIAEMIIEDISYLCKNNNWNGEGMYKNKNYKDELLNAISSVKKWQDDGYFVSYDVDKLASIVKESATPRQACQEIQNELGFHPTIEDHDFFLPSFLKGYTHAKFVEDSGNPELFLLKEFKKV